MLRSALAMIVLLLLPTMALAQNQPPVADAGEDQTIFLGDSVTLQGSATDPDGHLIVGWEWQVISAPAGSVYGLLNSDTAEPSLGADTAGDYLVTARASDGLAWSDPDAVIITFVENLPPDAVASASPFSGPAPLFVNFDGTASSDPEEGLLFYDWDFGDFTNGTGAITGHIYEEPGVYVARLMVTDDHGNIDFDTIKITVTEAAVPSIHPIALYTLLPSLLVGVGLLALRLRS